MPLNPLQDAILEGKTEVARALAGASPHLLNSRTDIGTDILDLARKKGVTSTYVAMLRAGAPGSQFVSNWPELLEAYIHELSDSQACAGWLTDIEYYLWYALTTSNPLPESFDRFGFTSIPTGAVGDLSFLADRSGVWFSHRLPVNLPKWNELYAEWLAELDLTPKCLGP